MITERQYLQIEYVGPFDSPKLEKDFQLFKAKLYLGKRWQRHPEYNRNLNPHHPIIGAHVQRPRFWPLHLVDIQKPLEPSLDLDSKRPATYLVMAAAIAIIILAFGDAFFGWAFS